MSNKSNDDRWNYVNLTCAATAPDQMSARLDICLHCIYVTQPCQSCWKQARWLCFNQCLKVNKKVSTTANCIGDRSNSLFAGYIIWLYLSKVTHNTMVSHKHTWLTITLNKYSHIIQQHQTHAINIFQTYTSLGSPNHRLKRKVWKFAKTCSIVFFFRLRSAWHLTREFIVYVYYIIIYIYMYI